MANSTKGASSALSLSSVYAQAYTGIEDLQTASIYMIVPCRSTSIKEGSINQATTLMLPNNYPVLGGYLTLTASSGCKVPNAFFAGSENIHFLNEVDGKVKVTHRDPWDDMAIQLGLKNITSKHIAEIMSPYVGYSFKSIRSGETLVVDEIMSGSFRGRALLLQDFILAHPGQLHIVAIVRNLPAIAVPKKTRKGEENVEKQSLPIEAQDILYIRYEKVGSPAYLNVVDRPNQLAIVDVGDRVIQSADKVEMVTKIMDTRVPASLLEGTSDARTGTNSRKKYYSRIIDALSKSNPTLLLTGSVKEVYTSIGKGASLPVCVFEMVNKLRTTAGTTLLTLEEHNAFLNGGKTVSTVSTVSIITPTTTTTFAAAAVAADELDAEEVETQTSIEVEAKPEPKVDTKSSVTDVSEVRSEHYKTREEEEDEEGAEMF